ncbi:hypothetical protein E8E14_001004 [Neopestalotiopsis sp. 37M]|nr:hypothetical protein E8E14_001004 [Neopestalotiopsis sp. 37M]
MRLSRIGAMEKIWFWYVYQVAWKLDGPVQNWILPFVNKDRTNYINHGNRGTGPGGMLTWPEFLQCLCQFPRGEKMPPPLEDDYETVASGLWELGYGVELGLMILFGKMKKIVFQKKQSTEEVYDDKSYVELSYLEIMGRLVFRLEHARIRNENLITSEVEALRDLTNRILSYREADTMKFLGGDVMKIFFPNGTGVVIETDMEDPDDPSKMVRVIDVEMTASDPNNETALKRVFGSDYYSLFKSWCKVYGSNEYIEKSQQFDKNHPASTHFWTIVRWRQAKHALIRPAEELKRPSMGKHLEWNYDDPNRPVITEISRSRLP